MKFLFYVLKDQPLQFKATAVFQMIMDVLILGQFHLYKEKGKKVN